MKQENTTMLFARVWLGLKLEACVAQSVTLIVFIKTISHYLMHFLKVIVSNRMIIMMINLIVCTMWHYQTGIEIYLPDRLITCTTKKLCDFASDIQDIQTLWNIMQHYIILVHHGHIPNKAAHCHCFLSFFSSVIIIMNYHAVIMHKNQKNTSTNLSDLLCFNLQFCQKIAAAISCNSVLFCVTQHGMYCLTHP